MNAQDEPTTETKDVVSWIYCVHCCFVDSQVAFRAELAGFRIVLLYLRHAPVVTLLSALSSEVVEEDEPDVRDDH